MYSLLKKKRFNTSFLPLETATKTKVVDKWAPHLRSTRYIRDVNDGISIIYWFSDLKYDTVRFFKNGELHRLHGPAITYYYDNGKKEEELWFFKGTMTASYRYNFNGLLLLCTFKKVEYGKLNNYCVHFSYATNDTLLKKTSWFKNY